MDRNIKIPKFDKRIAAAFQALDRGEADASQQKAVLKYIVNDICMHEDDPMVVGMADLTHYNLGRRFPSIVILDNIKIDLMSITETESE